jgi:mannose-6-phosphate isomerase-like protein (cupin superfamily)
MPHPHRAAAGARDVLQLRSLQGTIAMTTLPHAINLDEKFALITEHWSPRIVGQLNDLHIKAAKVQGEFIWHRHRETDELFIVHKGELTIKYRDRDVLVRAGEFHVVAKGTEHKPVADEKCEILLIEPVGTVNTGDRSSDRTVTEERWL